MLYPDHTIDVTSLNTLPMDGSVLEMLLVHDNVDENDINDISSCVISQEVETNKIPEESEISLGPEQEAQLVVI